MLHWFRTQMFPRPEGRRGAGQPSGYTSRPGPHPAVGVKALVHLLRNARVSQERLKELADRFDVIMELWKDERAQALQSEEQRATLTNIVLLIVAAGLGLVSQRKFGPGILVITLPMALLGVYGALSCLKYRERFSLHTAQARRLRAALARIDEDPSLEEGRLETKAGHHARYPFLSRVRLYALWVALHVGIALAGVVLSVCALVN